MEDIEPDQEYYRCRIRACSESQGPARGDFSTNYCNLRNLFCDADNDGCRVIYYHLPLLNETITTSEFATADWDDCTYGLNAGKLATCDVKDADDFEDPVKQACLADLREKQNELPRIFRPRGPGGLQ